MSPLNKFFSMKTIRTIIIALAIFVLAYVIWVFCRPEMAPHYKTNPAHVKSVQTMVDLCTTDLHEEIPIKDSINGKWIVARQVIDGKIRFDVENLRIESRGDTTVVYLPKERVDILEDASPNAYQVLDTWDGKSTFFPRTLTAAEENTLKSRWQRQTRQRIYARGYVKRARRQAVETLAPLLKAMHAPDTPVIIIDPTPDGNL